MSGKLLDTYPAGATIYALFDSFNSSGASVTLTGLAVTDVEIYKNGSVTQRASDAGIALLDTDGIDFDAITGIHGISIDLSDNTDAGFYAAGSQYTVVISSVTIDSQTVSFILGSFRIVAAEATAGTPSVNATQWAGAATATDDIALKATLAKGTDLTGFNDLDAAGVRTAVGLAAANLDTQLTAIDDYIDTEVAAIKSDTAAILLDTGTDGVVVAAASKTGYALSTAGIQAIWDALTSALVTAGSIGKLLVDNINDTISSRLASASYTAPDNTGIAAIQAKTDNLPSGVKKNTALANFPFVMVDSTDHITPKTGLTITAQRSLDGAAFGSCANAATELGNGVYVIDLAAGDLNGDTVLLRFTSTGADDRLVTIVTEP